MKRWNWIYKFPIRSRLLYGYLLIFVLVVLVGNTAIYSYVKSAINESVSTELAANVLSTRTIVESAAHATLINQLKLSAEKNLEVVTAIYQQDLKEKEAKRLAAKIILNQTLGESGSIYVVNSYGEILVHRDNQLIGKNIPIQDHMHNRIQRKYGYLEYNQVEQPEELPRIKAIYMAYFGPWDWIISAAIDKREKINFLAIDELRKAISSRQINKTCTSFILKGDGDLLVHPQFEGQNLSDFLDKIDQDPVGKMIETRKGRVVLPWKSPGDNQATELLVSYDYLPEFDWIIASSCIVDEYYRPLMTLKILTLIILLVLSMLSFSLSRHISKTISTPIKQLMQGLKAASQGDFSKRLSPRSTDEFGKLENYFNTFISQLQESEKGFRSIFENSVEGIFQFRIDGAITNVNPSFVSMLGYDSSQSILDGNTNFHEDLMVNTNLWYDLVDLIISERVVRGFELQLQKKSGTIFWCMLNARGIHDTKSGKIRRIEGFISDINDRKEAQVGQEKILQDLETMVGKRTAELSNRISELEQLDMLNRYMGEMGDMLQSCRAIEETFPVINQYMKKLFPQDNCILYLHDTSKQILDQVIPSFSSSSPYSSMTNDNCWALRRGKSYQLKDQENELTCDHVTDAPNGYVCHPLMAHGITIGLLNVVFEEDQVGKLKTIGLDRKTRLCSRLAEHLSLALANLKLQEELKRKSTTDSLTGLANRRYMEEIMQRQFHRLKRHNTPCSIIMIDVDHFKKFNDTYGHDLGDLVLKELGSYLNETTRGEDLACRFGGEEFVIIMVDTELDQAVGKAKAICAEVPQAISIPYQSETIHITISVGVAASPDHGTNSDDLIKSADNALYRAKNNGRNRVEVAAATNSIA